MICKPLQVPVLVNGSKQDHLPKEDPHCVCLAQDLASSNSWNTLCPRGAQTGARTDLCEGNRCPTMPMAWGKDNCRERAFTAL